MNDILIAYYSMGGNTRRVAEEIRAATGADLEEIREPHPRRGLPGVVRALFDATLRRRPAILAGTHDLGDYDLVVIGGPIWASRLAAPVRTFAQRHAAGAKRVAFFCTEGGQGADAAYADLERLSHRHPIGTFTVDAEHLEPGAHRSELGHFVACLMRGDAAASGGARPQAPGVPSGDARH